MIQTATTQNMLATSDLAAVRAQLELDKVALESTIAELKAGRDDEIAQRAMKGNKARAFNMHIERQLGDLEFELKQTNEALARNTALENDPAYQAAQQKRAELRQSLEAALQRLAAQSKAVDAAMVALHTELDNFDADCMSVRKHFGALRIGDSQALEGFAPDVISARIFGALSTHRLSRIIPMDQLRSHNKSMADMIAAETTTLRQIASIEMIDNNGKSEAADHIAVSAESAAGRVASGFIARDRGKLVR